MFYSHNGHSLSIKRSGNTVTVYSASGTVLGHLSLDDVLRCLGQADDRHYRDYGDCTWQFRSSRYDCIG